ncbi:hypothetical protein [Bradyrhizobium lablabi]|nr:hypothetical protein [Bradyrhizobium lablabi]MBR0695285.1 hypothetical protein [Bradyrhizobium lablabi]
MARKKAPLDFSSGADVALPSSMMIEGNSSRAFEARRWRSPNPGVRLIS